MQKLYLLIALIIGVITASSITILNPLGKTISGADASALAIIDIQRIGGDLHNPKLPVQHITVDLLVSSNSGIMQFISNIDSSYDTKLRDNFPQEFTLGKTAALAILQYVPFTYHDSESYPEYDVHSTIVELDGKYYFIVLKVPKQ